MTLVKPPINALLCSMPATKGDYSHIVLFPKY